MSEPFDTLIYFDSCSQPILLGLGLVMGPRVRTHNKSTFASNHMREDLASKFLKVGFKSPSSLILRAIRDAQLHTC